MLLIFSRETSVAFSLACSKNTYKDLEGVVNRLLKYSVVSDQIYELSVFYLELYQRYSVNPEYLCAQLAASSSSFKTYNQTVFLML